MDQVQTAWAVVVPLKRLHVAKTRLQLPTAARARLALAMAEDTIRACLTARSVTEVVVVTDEPAGRELARAAGAVVVDDEPDAGLNPALVHGAGVAAARRPGTAVATVASDLPALTGADLDAVLGAGASTFVVADAAGTGTVLLAAADVAAFRPAFGAGSYAAHLAAGATDRTAAASPRLRRDVDTRADLAAACRLGCGPATQAAVVALGLA